MSLQLQQLLEYPYEVMRAHIILIGCEQHGKYDSASHECKHCYDRVSCMWVNQLPNEEYDKSSGQKQMMVCSGDDSMCNCLANPGSLE